MTAWIPLWDWITWPFWGEGIPAPASANEPANLSSNGALSAVVVPKIGANFTAAGQLSMTVDFQLQNIVPLGSVSAGFPRTFPFEFGGVTGVLYRGTGMLVDTRHSTPGRFSGKGHLTGTAVATQWQLPWGVPPGTGVQTTIFENLPVTWQAMATKVIYIGIDGSFWNLAGNYAGREGLTLAPHMMGFMHSPFKSIFSEGPYQIGGHYERTDYGKREFKFGVMVGTHYGPDESSWRYRMLEQRWWRAWSPSVPGYLCCFTRTHGWRFLRVQLGASPETPIELDPIAFDNNFMQWDVTAVAAQPFWQKKWPAVVWENNAVTSTPIAVIQELLLTVNQFTQDLLSGLPADQALQPGKNIGSHTFNVWNNGDFPQWPKFLASAPGQVWIQDGPGGNMLQIPTLTDASQGPILIDTDPTARTISSPADPNDPLLFGQLDNAGLLNILLQPIQGGTTSSTLWSQFRQFFTTPCPPSSTIGNQPSQVKVYHSDPTGTVTCYMPQQFDKAYG